MGEARLTHQIKQPHVGFVLDRAFHSDTMAVRRQTEARQSNLFGRSKRAERISDRSNHDSRVTVGRPAR